MMKLFFNHDYELYNLLKKSYNDFLVKLTQLYSNKFILTLAMKKHISKIILLFLVLTFFTSCELVGDIFQAGMGFGIFLVILVIAIIVWIISKVKK